MLREYVLDSKVIRVHKRKYVFLFHILFHYGLSQDIDYHSLCCTVPA